MQTTLNKSCYDNSAESANSLIIIAAALQRVVTFTYCDLRHWAVCAANWHVKICFRLLAIMLSQSVNSGRQDRRKSLERAQQQARSLARLFALKAAFLFHYPFIRDDGMNDFVLFKVGRRFLDYLFERPTLKAVRYYIVCSCLGAAAPKQALGVITSTQRAACVLGLSVAQACMAHAFERPCSYSRFGLSYIWRCASCVILGLVAGSTAHYCVARPSMAAPGPIAESTVSFALTGLVCAYHTKLFSMSHPNL